MCIDNFMIAAVKRRSRVEAARSQLCGNNKSVSLSIVKKVSGTKFAAAKATCDIKAHTPSTAFRHLPPNSARFCHATEGALFTSAQLSSDAVSALRKVRVLI